MSVPTSRASYKKHRYSGPRKSLKRVRGGLRKFNAQESRLAWRSEDTNKKPVPITAQNTQLRTYARVKPKIHLEAIYSAPSNSTETAKLMVKPLEINWLQVDPEILEQVTTDPISLEIKTEPQEDEIPIVSQELTKPGTSKHKERKRTRTSQNTSTQSSLLEESEFNTEEIDVGEEGFS